MGSNFYQIAGDGQDKNSRLMSDKYPMRVGPRGSDRAFLCLPLQTALLSVRTSHWLPVSPLRTSFSLLHSACWAAATVLTPPSAALNIAQVEVEVAFCFKLTEDQEPLK